MDESGLGNQSQYIAVGALTFANGHGMLGNSLAQLRSKTDWRKEAHFTDIRKETAYLYREAVELAAGSTCRFTCVIADKHKMDPFSAKRPSWKSYAQLTIKALNELVGGRRPVMSVIVDDLITPAEVNYEGYITRAVNRTHNYLAVAGLIRMDSRSCWGLQMVDVLTGAVVHQYRQTSEPAMTATSVKGRFAQHVAATWGLPTLVGANSVRFNVVEL